MSRARSVVMLKQKLAKGISIFIYPEGSRNRSSDPLGPFYDGAFRIAIQTGAPIAVQTITNINRVTGPDDSWLQPGIVRIVWETPIETAQLTDADIPALRDRVVSMMTSRILEVRK
jgi:1-acyl-sn-glycerol-3-phosphate acyltransferase